MEKRKISELIFDQKLLAIRKIDTYTVSLYRQNMRSGAQFPPIIVDKKTGMIVSGNQRSKAYLAEFGPDHEIEVVVKPFKNRAEILKEFVSENLKHGRPMSGIEKRSAIIKLLNSNLPVAEISKLFNLPVKRIENWAGMSVMIVGNDGKEEPRPIKRGIEHLSGTVMESGTYQQHINADRGIPCASQANQLTRWIHMDLINKHDDRSVEALKNLYDALGEFFKEVEKVA